MTVVEKYATESEEAAERFARFRDTDPFPEIPPALLNASDIARYVEATGMIVPFHIEAEHLKPASYEVALAGQYVYWDEADARQSSSIEIGKPFLLKPNSIAFVTLEPYFRIPKYIALRFNLRITHIYRGILLGTGPLVDPGFEGKLSMPLHNLTTNSYEFLGGEGLIWMEFTKVSPRQGGADGLGDELPARKINLSLDQYLHKAAEGRAVKSSIPTVGARAAQAAREAADSAERSEGATRRTSNFVTTALLVAIVLGFITAVAAVASILSLINNTNARFDQFAVALGGRPTTAPSPLVEEVANLSSRVASLGNQLRLTVWLGGGALVAIVLGVYVFFRIFSRSESGTPPAVAPEGLPPAAWPEGAPHLAVGKDSSPGDSA